MSRNKHHQWGTQACERFFFETVAEQAGRPLGGFVQTKSPARDGSPDNVSSLA
jgi:hypothetical protein